MKSNRFLRAAVSPGPNPLAPLERLQSWWRGLAKARRMFADEARAVGRDKEADHHDQVAKQYESRAEKDWAALLSAAGKTP